MSNIVNFKHDYVFYVYRNGREDSIYIKNISLAIKLYLTLEPMNYESNAMTAELQSMIDD